MDSIDIAICALNRGKQWAQGALRALEDKRWNDVIYSCQMAIDLALRSVLIYLEIGHPKKENIHNLYYSKLKELRLPEWFLEKIENHSKILAELSNKKEISAYGYFDGVSEDYFKDDVNYYLENTLNILMECGSLIEEL
ncbi:MAG: HEPN domain-containing protein [Promethearchaeota archaeon]